MLGENKYLMDLLLQVQVHECFLANDSMWQALYNTFIVNLGMKDSLHMNKF